MPIVSISDTPNGAEVRLVCVECFDEETIPLASLTLGTDANADAIACPPCDCGSQEFLLQTFDVLKNEQIAGHRKIVNALAQTLKRAGRVHKLHKETIKASPTPTQIGDLFAVVPDASTATTVLRARRAQQRATAAVFRASESIEQAKDQQLKPDDPVALALQMFAQAQAAFDSAMKRTAKTPEKTKPEKG